MSQISQVAIKSFELDGQIRLGDFVKLNQLVELTKSIGPIELVWSKELSGLFNLVLPHKLSNLFESIG